MELARLGRWLDRIAYHQLTSVDTRWLAVARVLIAAIFLLDLATRAYLSPELASEPSLVTGPVGRAFATDSLPSVALGVDSPRGLLALFLITGLASIFVLVGFATKTAGVAMVILEAGLLLRHPALVDTASSLGLAVLVWILVLPCDSRGSVDAWLASRRGERRPSTAQTTWAWIGPVALLACCLVGGTNSGEVLRIPFGGGASAGVALRDGVDLSALGRATLHWNQEQIGALSGTLHGLALVGAALFLSPWQVRWTRRVGGLLLLGSGVISSALVATPVLWWAIFAIVAGLQRSPVQSSHERSRGAAGGSLERMLGLFTREVVGFTMTFGIVGWLVVVGVSANDRPDASTRQGAWTSVADARRGALLRMDAPSPFESVAVGPWFRLEVVVAEVSLLATDGSGSRYRWRDRAWAALEVDDHSGQPGDDEPGETRSSTGAASRHEGVVLARIAEHLYTYGAIELERMVWGAGEDSKSCAASKEPSFCIDTIELHVRRRVESAAMGLGDAEVVYTGRRSSPGRVALTPREGLNR